MAKKYGKYVERSAPEAPAEQEQPVDQAPEAPKVEFDVWWAMNAKKIPSHHHKEIIKADFGARGLSSMETAECFKEALGKYGLKLN